jgi:hypothetical protein
MTSSKILCFLQILLLLIGDLIPNLPDEHWELVLHLRSIFEIIHSKKIASLISIALAVVMKEYLQSLSHLKYSFEPKYHFDVHYPHILQLMGSMPVFFISAV